MTAKGWDFSGRCRIERIGLHQESKSFQSWEDAAEGTEQAANSARRSKSTITQLFSGISNVIKSSGNAIKGILTAIFKGIAETYKGFGQGMKLVLQGLKGLSSAQNTFVCYWYCYCSSRNRCRDCIDCGFLLPTRKPC